MVSPSFSTNTKTAASAFLRSTSPPRRSRPITLQNRDVWQSAEDWEYAPAISPDSTRFAYLRDVSDGSQLRIRPIAGDSAADPIIVGEVDDTEPAWLDDHNVVVGFGHRTTARIDLGTLSTGMRGGTAARHALGSIGAEYVSEQSNPLPDRHVIVRAEIFGSNKQTFFLFDLDPRTKKSHIDGKGQRFATIVRRWDGG